MNEYVKLHATNISLARSANLSKGGYIVPSVISFFF